MGKSERIYTVAEVAEELDVTTRHVRTLAARAGLKREGRSIPIPGRFVKLWRKRPAPGRPTVPGSKWGEYRRDLAERKAAESKKRKASR